MLAGCERARCLVEASNPSFSDCQIVQHLRRFRARQLLVASTATTQAVSIG